MKLSRNQWIGVIVALIVIVLFFFQFFGEVFFSESSLSEPNNVDFVMETQEQDTSGVVITDSVVGQGTEATSGSVVTVHYTGTLEDGTVFDSSVSRGTPLKFILGVGQVIRGWDVGVAGMKIGGKRELRISPEAAYGPQGVQNPQTGEYIIPANATLIFEVELLGVESLQQAQ